MRRPQNWKKSPTCFDKTAVFTQKRQNKWEIFSNFCGLLIKTELYKINVHFIFTYSMGIEKDGRK